MKSSNLRESLQAIIEEAEDPQLRILYILAQEVTKTKIPRVGR